MLVNADHKVFMRTFLFILFLLPIASLHAQSGYIKVNKDSTIVGFLRYYVGIRDGRPGYELWRTKTDKNPIKIPKAEIYEYAIKNDTFKVLQQFKPFPDSDTYFELVDAELKNSGKVNLYVIANYVNAQSVSVYNGGGVIPAIILDSNMGHYSYIYILEDPRTNSLRALPSKHDELLEALMDFFPEKYITKYETVKGKITYKTVPDVVELYNSR